MRRTLRRRRLVERATSLVERGRWRDAEPLLRAAVSAAQRAGATRSREMSTTLNLLGLCCQHLARFAEAGPLYQRALLIDHHLDGRGVSEIAVRLGIPVGTVKSQLFTARQALEAALGEADQ